MANKENLEQTEGEVKIRFGSEIDLFIKHIDSIGNVLLGMVFAVQEGANRAKRELVDFEEKNCTVTKTGSTRKVSIPLTHIKKWEKLRKRFEHFNHSHALLPRSLLVSLISQYDAYLGRLLRAIFILKPEILNVTDKKFSYEAIAQFSSIDALREHILEKEVEDILRSSHSEQFKWMENTFKLPLTKDLSVWSEFIEITERRNLFVHTDGIVSSQYMSVCNSHKSKLEKDVKEGEKLSVPQKYFESSHYCIYEIGVKLGHVLWRKLFPNDREFADSKLIQQTYELIENGNYALAIRMLDFACNNFHKTANESSQLILTINRAQSQKWLGNDKECKEIMAKIDWSAKGEEFKLANHVLSEDWSKSVKTMRVIGKTGAVGKNHYRDWPLFREFRKQTSFLETFKEIFEEDFLIDSEIDTHEILDDKEKTLNNLSDA